MKNKLFLIANLGLASITIAQTSTEKLWKFKPSAIQVQTGGGALVSPNYTGAEIENFSGEQGYKDFTKGKDLTDQFSHGWYGNSQNTSLYVEFDRLKKNTSEYRKNQSLRFGIWHETFNYTYYDFLSSGGGLSSTDTLTGSGSEKYYLEKYSVSNNSIEYSYNSIRLDASYIFKTGENNQIGLYSGLGLSLGGTYGARVSTRESSSTRSSLYNDSQGNIISGQGNSTSDDGHQNHTYAAKNSFFGSVYIPIGADLRWSTNNDFLKRVHNTFELRPTISVVGGRVQSSIYGTLGLKFDL